MISPKQGTWFRDMQTKLIANHLDKWGLFLENFTAATKGADFHSAPMLRMEGVAYEELHDAVELVRRQLAQTSVRIYYASLAPDQENLWTASTALHMSSLFSKHDQFRASIRSVHLLVEPILVGPKQQPRKLVVLELELGKGQSKVEGIPVYLLDSPNRSPLSHFICEYRYDGPTMGLLNAAKNNGLIWWTRDDFALDQIPRGEAPWARICVYPYRTTSREQISALRNQLIEEGILNLPTRAGRVRNYCDLHCE